MKRKRKGALSQLNTPSIGSALADTRFTSTLDVGENLGLCPSDAQPIAGVARAGDEANLSGG